VRRAPGPGFARRRGLSQDDVVADLSAVPARLPASVVVIVDIGSRCQLRRRGADPRGLPIGTVMYSLHRAALS